MPEDKEKKVELKEKDLEKASGGDIEWGPFHDAVLTCPVCGKRSVYYTVPVDCFYCKSTIWE